MSNKHTYEVIVGNIGTAHRGTNFRAANQVYRHYVKVSKGDMGRAAGEPVTLMKDGEPHFDYCPDDGECGRCGSMPGHRDLTCPECCPDSRPEDTEVVTLMVPKALATYIKGLGKSAPAALAAALEKHLRGELTWDGPRFVVDGSAGDGTWMTGCLTPPFAVFDIEEQQNVCEAIIEHKTAQAIADALNDKIKELKP